MHLRNICYRLWHQLTEEVQAFYRLEKGKEAFPLIFSQFISIWHRKMNQLVYVKLAMETAKQLSPTNALNLLEDITMEMKELKEVEGPALVILSTMAAAQYKLRSGDLVGAKAAIDECSETAEGYASVDAIIPATYFLVAADYDKATMAFSSFYKNALIYLACQSKDEVAMKSSEMQERAHDLCVAALLGDNIYNFGELLIHPILELLKGTSYEFLTVLLHEFNRGHVETLDTHTSAISKHPTLSGRLEFLRQKLFLMTLVEAIFHHLKTNRLIPFSVISQATRVPLDQVEFLLIKSLSLKLVKGTIKEPEQVFEIEWVQPRVLDLGQIEELRLGISKWRAKVQETSKLIHTILPETITSLAQ